MILPSASSLQRAMACRGSLTLPEIHEENENAKRGTEVHKFLAAIVTGKSMAEALSLVDEKYHKDCKEVDIDALPSDLTDVKTEVTYKYNPFTGTADIVGFDLGRDYSSVDRHLFFVGTADITGVKPDGTFYIGDFKTGAAFDVPKASSNWQLLLLALAASRAGSYDKVESAIIRTLGEVRYDSHVVDAIDMAASAEALHELATWCRGRTEKSEDAKVAYVTGGHCKYCPSKLYCPAKVALIKSIVGMPHKTKDDILALITPENAVTAYRRWQEVKAILRIIEPAFRQYALDNPISLPNGKTFGPRETESTEIDAEVARAVLAEMHGTRVAESACSFETTKKAIKNSLRDVAPAGQLAKTEREVFAKIRERGGVKKVVKKTIDEH